MPKPASTLKYCDFPGCDYKAKTPNVMKRHEQTHSTDPHIQRPHKCNNCPHRASLLKELKKHILTCHGEEAPSYKCSTQGCKYKTKVREYLEIHVKRRHYRVPLTSCTFEGCEYQAKYIKLVKEHALKCHGHDTTIQKKIQCPMCSKKFCHTFNLRKHVRAHMKEKPWKCSLCSYESKKKDGLIYHRESFHGEIVKSVKGERYQCKICDFSTSFLVRYNCHVRYHHTEERPYACSFPECSVKFKRKGDFKMHQTLHAPEQHPCPQPNCSYVAKNRHLLTAHRRNHKSPFPCVFPSCNSKFRTEVGLLSHQRFHDPNRPFQCDHCPLRFKAKPEVRSHVKGRHKEKRELQFPARMVHKTSRVYSNTRGRKDKVKIRGSTQARQTGCQEHYVLNAVAIVVIPRIKVYVY